MLKTELYYFIGLRSNSSLREHREHSYKEQIGCFKINAFKANKSLCAFSPNALILLGIMRVQSYCPRSWLLHEESIKCLSQILQSWYKVKFQYLQNVFRFINY